MIRELVDYIDANSVSLSKGTNLFPFEIPESVSVDSVVVFSGRFGNTETDATALDMEELIVQAHCRSPKDAESMVKAVRTLLINKANIAISGVGSVTFTGAPVRYIRRDEHNRCVANCALVARTSNRSI